MIDMQMLVIFKIKGSTSLDVTGRASRVPRESSTLMSWVKYTQNHKSYSSGATPSWDGQAWRELAGPKSCILCMANGSLQAILVAATKHQQEQNTHVVLTVCFSSFSGQCKLHYDGCCFSVFFICYSAGIQLC